MLSLRLLSSSFRGVSALTSNQLGSSMGAQPCPVATTTITTSQDRYRLVCSGTAVRELSTANGVLCQAARYSRAGKINVAPSDADLSLPSRPKKPVTPWIMFVRERKDQIMGQHGKISAAEMSVILAQEWRQVDKSKYEREYEQLHDAYEQQLKDYEDSLTDEQRDLIGSQKDAKRETKAMKQLRKTHPPVLPRNSANFYCQERSKHDDVKERMKTQKASEVFRSIFEEYRSLSESEKKKYLDMQEDDKSRFQHEFLAWYEGVQNNENLSKAARDQANAMRDRLRALTYI